MKSAKTSLFIFGLYLIVIPGMGLMLIPEFILELFRMSYGEIIWGYRMIGLLAALIGGYYLVFTRYNLLETYKWSVLFRLIASGFMVLLWITKQVEAGILLFALIDILGAWWTYTGLENEKIS